MFSLYSNHLRPSLGDDNHLYWDYNASYINKVLGYSPIAYWPMNETSGLTAIDKSGNGYDGTYTGVTLGQTGIGDGNTCPLFDGANDFVDIYSAGLAGAFNKAEGSALIWAKMFDVGVWSDATARYAMMLQADASNNVNPWRRHGNNDELRSQYRAAGAVESLTSLAFTGELDWMLFGITWSKSAGANGEVKHYMNDAKVGATNTNLGIWVGALAATTTVIGSLNNTPAGLFHGWLAQAMIFDTPLALADIQDIYSV